MIWNKDIETASKAHIEEIQLARLKHTVRYCYENVRHYHDRFDAMGLSPDCIRSLDDIRRLPFTTKDDLRENYPYNFFAVPMKRVVRIHASSGTTGKPTVVGYTKADIEMWAECIARLAGCAGVTEDDIAQITFGYSLFTGAFGLHYGLEKLGATVIPISSGNTERQINTMRDFGSTVLVGTPSYAMYLAETAAKMGVDAHELPLRVGMFGGEGSTDEMRAQLEARLGILATENYGLSEVIGPGCSGECHVKQGMHINADHFIVEIVDPDTLEPVREGERGEVVITALSKEALPILRYRTKDISSLITEPCACGRTSPRMTKIRGRTDDMLIIRGVNVFPSQIEGVLLAVPEIGPHYEIVVTRDNYLDNMTVKVELIDANLLLNYSSLTNLQRRIQKQLFTVLGLTAKVELTAPETLKRFEGKAKRVTDLREDK